MNKLPLLFVIPFCSIFVIIGGVVMVITGRKIHTGIQAREWSQASGRILSVNSEDHSTTKGGSREILVHYSYHAAGRDYEGTTIHPTYTSSSFEDAHRGLETLLHPGQRVRVYFNPSQPDISTLSAGFYSCSLAMFAAGGLFFAMGMGFILTSFFALAGSQDYASGITILH